MSILRTAERSQVLFVRVLCVLQLGCGRGRGGEVVSPLSRTRKIRFIRFYFSVFLLCCPFFFPTKPITCLKFLSHPFQTEEWLTKISLLIHRPSKCLYLTRACCSHSHLFLPATPTHCPHPFTSLSWMTLLLPL